MPNPTASRPPMVIGWREHVSLHDLGLPLIEAKIDTGARTSALHAKKVKRFERDGVPWVRFHIPHSSGLKACDVEAPLVDERAIKNTSGQPEDRLIIKTTLGLGARRWKIEISLADRSNMSLPLILGRTSIRRHNILVDAGRSLLAGYPIGHPNDTSRV